MSLGSTVLQYAWRLGDGDAGVVTVWESIDPTVFPLVPGVAFRSNAGRH